MWLFFWIWFGNDYTMSFFLPAFGVSIKDWGKRKARERVESEWGVCEVNVESEWRMREREKEREREKKEREHEKSMWRVSEERMWGVYGECVCEWKESACGLCEICERCVWRVCVTVKGEHTEVCMSVRVQEKKKAQEKSREHKRMQSVCSLKLRANEQEEKESREWERRERKL